MLRLSEYIFEKYCRKVVEVGIGNFSAVAELLASRNFYVVATDIVKRQVPENVEFYVDDIRNPELKIYEGASLVYSIRPPPEIVNDIVKVAKIIGADCIIKPLYGDYFDGELINFKGLPFYLFPFSGRRKHD